MKNPFRWPTGLAAATFAICLASKTSTLVTCWCAFGLALTVAIDLRRAYLNRTKP